MNEEIEEKETAEDINEAAVSLDKVSLVKSEEDTLPAETTEDALEAEEETEEETEEEVRIFGLTRNCFRLTVLGVAAGYIVSGLLKLESTTAPIIICGAIGYGIGKLLEKKKAKKDEAEKNA